MRPSLGNDIQNRPGLSVPGEELPENGLGGGFIVYPKTGDGNRQRRSCVGEWENFGDGAEDFLCKVDSKDRNLRRFAAGEKVVLGRGAVLRGGGRSDIMRARETGIAERGERLCITLMKSLTAAIPMP